MVKESCLTKKKKESSLDNLRLLKMKEMCEMKFLATNNLYEQGVL